MQQRSPCLCLQSSMNCKQRVPDKVALNADQKIGLRSSADTSGMLFHDQDNCGICM